MKVYLAGPMRNLPAFNFPAFHTAAAALRLFGHDVWNPAEHDEASGFNPHTDEPKPLKHYMVTDLAKVCESDAVVVLPGWQKSQGATLEMFVAQVVGVRVLEYPSLDEIAPDPRFEAWCAVHEMMLEGLKKHSAESWRTEPFNNHALKSARHATTAALIREKLSPDDGENHIRNAICRGAMALAQQKAKI